LRIRVKKRAFRMLESGSASIRPDNISTPSGVVIVVPVYRNSELTRACLASAMPAVMRIPGATLVAINDASPDAEMDDTLDAEASRWSGRMVVLRNETNLGFVKSANRGIRYDPSADIVLLNNDVIVPDRWLERLAGDAHALPNAGTVTPLSNNTTISAFPNFMRENALPLALDLERIDEAFGLSRLDPVEAPTGIGFCMYIKRCCLQDVGELDEVTFGAGYGEENDFCQRALRKGWKSYISPNLYVYHRGGVSFGDQRKERMRHADRVLDRRYPRWHVDVQAFVVRDALRGARLQRYFDLLRVCGLPVVLHVSHGLGGGVDQHIRDLSKRSEGRAVSLLLRSEDGGRVISIGAWNADASMRISLEMKHGIELLLPLLRAIGVDMVHYHHVLGWPSNFLSLGAALKARQIFTCHDFYLVNGNPTLTNERGLFDSEAMDMAVNPLYPLPKGMTLEAWRQRYQWFLNACTRVIFPSHATYDLFRRFFEIRSPVLAYHPDANQLSGRLPVPFMRKSAYTIGVLGALSREKGADLLEALASLVASRRIKLRFTLIGYAYRVLKRVRATGPYENDFLSALIEREGCDLILFPALCPETYSYTLSAALGTGLPIVATSIGAFPERLAGRAHTRIYQHPPSPESLLGDILSFLSELEEGGEAKAPVLKIQRPQLDYYDDQYVRDVGVAKRPTNRTAMVEGLRALLSAQTVVTHGRQEKLLRALWGIYTQPRLQGVFRLIPHRLKRLIKRALSTKPLHELIRDY